MQRLFVAPSSEQYSSAAVIITDITRALPRLENLKVTMHIIGTLLAASAISEDPKESLEQTVQSDGELGEAKW